ncbi:MAG: InlB B-repeat-containing protein [Anaerobutyricum soehngenii]
MPDFSGWTGYQTMDGNTNCRAWADWQTTRVFRNGQAGWDVRIILKANKTTSSPTYGTGNTQVGAHQTNSSVDTKYMTIVQSETTFRDETVFVPAEAGADIPLAAYANIHIPNVVSKGIKFTVTAKRNLWGVYFNANGGSGAPEWMKRHWGEIVYIPSTTPYKSGYTFNGWTKTQGSSTINYKPGDPIGDDSDVTLYAVWSQNVVKTWSITYNANGGSNAPAKQTANVGQFITITYSKPTRSGYTFLGWSTWNESPEPEAMFTPGYSYTSDSDTTLYAVWERVNTDPPSLYFPDTYGINLDFNYIPQLSIRANVTNPQDRTIYYKVCYVDNYYGDIYDYYLNSNGNTGTISQTTLDTQIPVTSTIIKKSIQNCNSETEFKLAICVSYENIFDNNAPEMKKYLVTVSINNYQKPIIKELYVGRTADGGAQLDTVFKYADSFTKITTGYTGVSVYIDDFIASSSEYTESNSFVGGAKNTINSLLTFINSAVSDYSHVFKIRVDDGIFYTEKTYILGVLRSDGNIYIYSDGRVEANGFVKLNSTDEDAILFKDGGFVYAKNFKKIVNGVYLCPDVFEMFGRENTSMAYLLNQN